MPSLKEIYFLNEGVAKTPPGPFKLGQFRKFKDLPERVQYLNTRTNVTFVNKGSSRAVYMINNGKLALKLGLFQRGKAQNKVEFNSTSCPNAKHFIPKMFAKSVDYSWIIVEPVEQFKNSREFEQATAVPLRFIEIGITFVHPDFAKNYKKSNPTYKKYEKIYRVLSERNPWYNKLINMAATCNLIPGDAAKFDSWGLTKRGRVVLLDPGVTDEVWKKYYEKFM
jgi:hypothetical protein